MRFTTGKIVTYTVLLTRRSMAQQDKLRMRFYGMVGGHIPRKPCADPRSTASTESDTAATEYP